MLWRRESYLGKHNGASVCEQSAKVIQPSREKQSRTERNREMQVRRVERKEDERSLEYCRSYRLQASTRIDMLGFQPGGFSIAHACSAATTIQMAGNES